MLEEADKFPDAECFGAQAEVEIGCKGGIIQTPEIVQERFPPLVERVPDKLPESFSV